ncbi:hypothetical protein Gasu2_40150 [Galdieria sulphuraria]|uniref:Zinc finger (C3HC4-type RING finger) family protein n=1 Tax=Galdieria sulphuraria TaxID=130081 RepID=M2XVA1_GALSU|nr:zinc finger (C3HC4-type RING finger) family protein [Galdieria sulphuraria]EME27588.1 zinc finger (C3HC4-type RING finger) family protein [Galdieria sulphuraria]GJD09784.1 hypothetical protein Gasu2_40150 [Galdieria sulphuraria]|eukprot:XP_005704108.1 zinc finger (C3HC4-type RING finger) family protein [Galdieria sulphuraria]
MTTTSSCCYVDSITCNSSQYKVDTGQTVDEEQITVFELKEDTKKKATLMEDSEEDFACAICFELIVPGDGALELPCSHLFHSDCIVQWLLNHQHCPICRTLLPQFDFQSQPVSKQSNRRQLITTETEENRPTHEIMRLHFSDGIRRTTRLLFLQPGRHIKRGFLQFSSFLKLVFHEVSEPFHVSRTQSHESVRNTGNTSNSSRALYNREHTRRALEPPRRSKKNVFKRFWSKLVHKNSSSQTIIGR